MTIELENLEQKLRASLQATVPRLLEPQLDSQVDHRLGSPRSATRGADLVVTSQRASGPRRRWALAAAAALVVVGTGGLVAWQLDRKAPEQVSTAPTVPTTAPETSPGTSADTPSAPPERVLLPPTDAEVTSAQLTRRRPGGETSGLFQAGDGSTFSLSVVPNYWQQLPAEWEQREVGGIRWWTGVEDVHRSYVTLTECAMISVGAGPAATPWNDNALALLDGVWIGDRVDVVLPEGWSTLALGNAGEWFITSYDAGLPDVPDVTLSQLPGANAGPLLAQSAGRPIERIVVAGLDGWRIGLSDAGSYLFVWQALGVAAELLYSDLSDEQLAQVIGDLVPATSDEWTARYAAIDAGRDMTYSPSTCGPGTAIPEVVVTEAAR